MNENAKELIKSTVAQVTVAEHEGNLVAVAVAYISADGKVRWSYGYAANTNVPLLGALRLLASDIDNSTVRDRKPPT